MGEYIYSFYCMNSPGFIFKYNEICMCLYLRFAHFTCIVLQLHKFHCHYSKLQYEKLRKIIRLVINEESNEVVTNSISSYTFDISRRGICFEKAG